MVEGRMTAPEDGPEQPASCWGHREPAYPQCNAARTHQPTHNNPRLLLSLLMEHNLFHKPFSLNGCWNTCIWLWSTNESEPPFHCPARPWNVSWEILDMFFGLSPHQVIFISHQLLSKIGRSSSGSLSASLALSCLPLALIIELLSAATVLLWKYSANSAILNNYLLIIVVIIHSHIYSVWLVD